MDRFVANCFTILYYFKSTNQLPVLHVIFGKKQMHTISITIESEIAGVSYSVPLFQAVGRVLVRPIRKLKKWRII